MLSETFMMNLMGINFFDKFVEDHLTREFKMWKMKRIQDLSLAQTSDLFTNDWKQKYKLYTDQQQQYFMCYILAIAANIKYIDIEFEHQIVSLPLHTGKAKKYKADILHMVNTDLNEDGKEKKVQVRWMQSLSNNQAISPISLFTAEEAIFLRFAECVRKYVLESELGDTLHTLWPWYRNSLHCGYGRRADNELYNSLLMKYGRRLAIGKRVRKSLRMSWKKGTKCKIFVYFASGDSKQHWLDAEIIDVIGGDEEKCVKVEYKVDGTIETANFRRSSHRLSERTETDDRHETAPIRHKRKFAASQLLNESEIERNLNIIKYQLDLCLDAIVEDEHIDPVEIDWKQRIHKTNIALKNKFIRQHDKHQLLKLNLQNLETLDITDLKLIPFEQFVFELFVQSDQELYENYTQNDHYFLQMWLEDWRHVPEWYSYQHDVLLLELVMRNGINMSKIIDDLEGDQQIEYKLRLGNVSDAHFRLHHRLYYHFKRWCRDKINVLRRLKHITNIIVQNLQMDEYKPSLIDIRIRNENDRPIFDGQSVVFSCHQRKAHQSYTNQREFVEEQTNLIMDISNINVTALEAPSDVLKESFVT